MSNELLTELIASERKLNRRIEYLQAGLRQIRDACQAVSTDVDCVNINIEIAAIAEQALKK